MARTTYKRKRAAKPYMARKKRRYAKKKTGASGFLKTVRWSNRDTTNYCHIAIPGTATGTVSAIQTSVFYLSDIQNAAEFTSLFDNYRINKVMYRWVLRRDPTQSSVNPGTLPRVSWVHDFNDQLSPAQIQQLRQHANLREAHFSESNMKTKWYTLNCSTLELVYRTALTNATGPQWRKYIDTSLVDVPHYGIKFLYDGLYTGVNLFLEAKLMMEFKGVC